MEKYIFSWIGSDMNDVLDIQYYDCEFKVDFGPWKQGQKVRCLRIDYSDGTMESYDTDGKVIDSTHLALVATRI